MEEQEKEILLLQQQSVANKEEIKEVKQDFKNRLPAPKTADFITEVKLTMAKQTDQLEVITKTLDMHISDQKTNDAKIQVSLEENQKAIFTKFEESKTTMTKFIERADSEYADAEQFRFWRNLLIAGLLLSVVVGVIGIWLDKLNN